MFRQVTRRTLLIGSGLMALSLLASPQVADAKKKPRAPKGALQYIAGGSAAEGWELIVGVDGKRVYGQHGIADGEAVHTQYALTGTVRGKRIVGGLMRILGAGGGPGGSVLIVRDGKGTYDAVIDVSGLDSREVTLVDMPTEAAAYGQLDGTWTGAIPGFGTVQYIVDGRAGTFAVLLSNGEVTLIDVLGKVTPTRDPQGQTYLGLFSTQVTSNIQQPFFRENVADLYPYTLNGNTLQVRLGFLAPGQPLIVQLTRQAD